MDIDQRIARLEREVARLRGRNVAMLLAGGLAIGIACGGKTEPSEPPTSLEFGKVRLDDSGLQIGPVDKGVRVDERGLHVSGDRGFTTITAAHVAMSSGDPLAKGHTVTIIPGMVSVTASETRDNVAGSMLKAESLRISDGGYAAMIQVDRSHARIETQSKAAVSVATASLESKGVDAVVEVTVKRGDKADTKRLAATEK